MTVARDRSWLPIRVCSTLTNTMHGYNDVVRAVFVACVVLLKTVLGKHFTDLWAVHIKGGEAVAKNVSSRHGFIYRGQVLFFLLPLLSNECVVIMNFMKYSCGRLSYILHTLFIRHCITITDPF